MEKLSGPVVAEELLCCYGSENVVQRARGGGIRVHPDSMLVQCCVFTQTKSLRARGLVDLKGFEPLTSSMPWKRAPNCATGPQEEACSYSIFADWRAIVKPGKRSLRQ